MISGEKRKRKKEVLQVHNYVVMNKECPVMEVCGLINIYSMMVYQESTSRVDFVCRGHSLAVASGYIERTTTNPSLAVNIFKT